MKAKQIVLSCTAIIWLLLLGDYTLAQSGKITKAALRKSVNLFLTQWVNTDNFPEGYNYHHYHGKDSVELKSLSYDPARKMLRVYFNKSLAEKPFRSETVLSFKSKLKEYLPKSLADYKLHLFTNKKTIDQLVPNYYRKERLHYDRRRLPSAKKLRPKRRNIVDRKRSYNISAGLQSSNIALWNSHGWYYEQGLDRWEWQRARLFTTVEDLLPTSFVVPFLMPMLENAGATVFSPRERDLQKLEVIVDNDSGGVGEMVFSKSSMRSKANSGFAVGKPPYVNTNPFRQGTYLTSSDSIMYYPEFQEKGEYGVYVSYGKGFGKALYQVFYSGGKAEFVVDQTAGFGTWVYLGRFLFEKGKGAKVVVKQADGAKHKLTADAIRFGGGMGVISRNGLTSERPKYLEAARYFMQYTGAPDSLVWKLKEGKHDYAEDYQGRGEWVNWLMGTPFGPTDGRKTKGLNIPIDLSFAFHTDAGQLTNDSIVGSLTIYSTKNDKGFFPDGQSKYASRDLADIVQSQVVDDINKKYKANWTRRGMWNKGYSEAYRPNVPTMLLELLSHQNLNDIRYALHPQFRFDVSRSVYKGILRFLATQYNYKYVVQPLPVDHLHAKFTGDSSVMLKWQPVVDPIEETAVPTHYVVYQRVGDAGFDSGRLVDKPELEITGLEKGKLYSYKVTAVNAGGESFPSEVLSLGMSEKAAKTVLVVNGFDRVDAPNIFDADSLSGIHFYLDNGVAYHQDIGTVGAQYDFDRKSPWLDDDSPGHGASYADLETNVFMGNTFDFAKVHGKAIMAAGFSFISSSDEAVESGLVKLSDYPILDLLYGEEKASHLPGNDTTEFFSIYTPEMLSALEAYTKQGGNILISGANIGTDIGKDKALIKRVGKLLKFKWRTDHAAKKGYVYSRNVYVKFTGKYETNLIQERYAAESPDAIEPFNASAKTAFRYKENNMSAGVIYKGKYSVVAFGFPLECITEEVLLNDLFNQIFKKVLK